MKPEIFGLATLAVRDNYKNPIFVTENATTGKCHETIRGDHGNFDSIGPTPFETEKMEDPRNFALATLAVLFFLLYFSHLKIIPNRCL